jgi:hypothetical protein
MFKDLNKYDITIDAEYSEGKELGINLISYTSKPAVKIKGMAYSSHLIEQKFADNLKYRITAPALVPEEIYRKDDDEQYFVVFTAEEIDKIHQKFMSNLTNKGKFNVEHNKKVITPSYLLETWIVEDPKTDKAYTKFGIEVPKGTLMMTTQFEDKEYYTKIVEEGKTGFSVEGFFGMIPQITNNKIKEEKMAEAIKLPDGEWTIDGKVYVVKDGVVLEVKEIEATEEVKEEEKVELTEEVKEEEKVEMEEEVKEEEKVEMQEGVVAETYTKEEVDAKFEELIKMIGELKAKTEETVVVEEALEDKVKEQEFSITDRYTKVMNFIKN